MLPPIAIGIAVTRYRLYEIDRLISRGLSWAVLSGLLLAVYATPSSCCRACSAT